MLAYVFWHAPTSAIDPAEYEELLRLFHVALAARPSRGFVGSFSTRTSELPWLNADVAYEDWYLLANSAALDPLDIAAVDVSRRNVHDAAARFSRVGTGGLYRLMHGRAVEPTQTIWFAKPAGTTYADFDSVLAPFRERDDVVLWQRQMVLGPAPEYAAQTAAGITEGFGDVRVTHTKLTARRP